MADRSIVFKGKENLKQGAVVRPLWVNALRAAAAVALLVGGVFAFQQYGTTEQDTFAGVIDSKGKTIPALKAKQPKNTTAFADNSTPNTIVNTQPKKVVAPDNNTVIIPDNNTVIEYAKTEPLYLNTAQAAVTFEPTQLDIEQPTASYMALPYFDMPTKKPTLLNDMMASLRKRIGEGVKDEEMAHRLDTITKRGPELSDLAFMGSKGFEKLTGFKPSFRKTQKDNNTGIGIQHWPLHHCYQPP
ncbi:MAG: hypothetical protein M0D57_03690 [Sphingobacteriales bacterium JAD_PAG50586_3]|nr:MAG: hypothetical protein M0D57_03690 [Sphingobacteriales bacterium JAD_PAG50586_3]